MSGDEAALSLRNPRVQHLRRLIGRRKSRTEADQFVFEGPTLVAEALAAGASLDTVFVDGDADALVDSMRGAVAGRADLRILASGVLEKVADTKAPQGVIAVAPRPSTDVTALFGSEARGLVLVLDRVNDPGNAGSIVRTAEAVGAAAVVFADRSTDPFGPKAVRAAAGSAFRVSLYEAGSTVDLLEELGRRGFARMGAVAGNGDDYRTLDLTGDVALVVGSEAHGLDSEVEAALDRRVWIPTRGSVESLNVATAAGVLGFERLRQLDAAAGAG